MSSWIYPIGNPEYYFKLKDGTQVDATVENYIRHIQEGNFPQYHWWHVQELYQEVDSGDVIYIYSPRSHQDLGIIGYAIVEDKDDRVRKELYLKFDLDKSRQLIERPIPADKVRSRCRIPYNPVGRILPQCQEVIERYLS